MSWRAPSAEFKRLRRDGRRAAMRGLVRDGTPVGGRVTASLFCEHKRLRSVCPLCGSARAGAATPMRAAAAHDVDDTIHRFRHACHARLRDFLTRVHGGAAPGAAYAGAYDPMG